MVDAKHYDADYIEMIMINYRILNMKKIQIQIKRIMNKSAKELIWKNYMSIPLDPDNRHYAEILKQVKEGTLTIKDAE